ncbi:MAG TPA: SO2930 family diheme c-type cytochrome [Thermomonas sp.]
MKFFAEGMPQRLSDWRIVYVADGRLRLNARVEPYTLDTPLFTDYAHKLRTVWMPEGKAARYQLVDTLDFPVGTIITKTFYYPLPDTGRDVDVVLRSVDDGPEPDGGLSLDRVRLVETRLLVRRAAGWVALPYVWNAEQTEARLMRGGELLPLTLVSSDGRREQVDYAVPDANQCAGCHGTDLKSKAVFPIGPKVRHLNHDFAYAGGSLNQLARWQQVGYLSGVPAGSLPRNPSWDDPAAPLDARARSYLDINCGHCHSQTGAARTSGMWLDATTRDLLRLGRCKLPIAAGQGTGNRRWDIVPGKPEASILPFRMGSVDPGVMMPELGRSVAHAEGVALIRDWIAHMPAGECGT